MNIESDLYMQCLNCVHYKGGLPNEPKICDAFPDGIPQEIIDGDFDHSKPYPGDNDIRFELKPKKERVMIY